ncbi:MAG: DAK2 domain-containing protein, partial [Hungatella sp.]
AKSKPGEKTILDALCPAVEVLKANSAKSAKEAFDAAAKAASEGSEKTKAMRSVHGRAAYYGDKSIGILDGGSVVGKLLFTAIADYLA